MSTLAKIRTAGFTVKLLGDSFEIKPASNLSQSQRAFLKSHKAEIIAELRVALIIAEPESTPVQVSVYYYRTTDNPTALLTMITQGKSLEEAREVLFSKFGDRLVSVELAVPTPHST